VLETFILHEEFQRDWIFVCTHLDALWTRLELGESHAEAVFYVHRFARSMDTRLQDLDYYLLDTLMLEWTAEFRYPKMEIHVLLTVFLCISIYLCTAAPAIREAVYPISQGM